MNEDQRDSDGVSDETLVPEDPTGEAREQLKENDKHLRKGDQPLDEKRSDSIDAEQREKHDEDEEANHLLHGEDLPDPEIEP